MDHDPAQVVSEMAGVLHSYGIRGVTGDRYAGAWPGQEFMKHLIHYEPSDKDKSSLYLDFLPLVLSQRVELLDLNPLAHELRSLERRTRSAGRDLIDHPLGDMTTWQTPWPAAVPTWGLGPPTSAASSKFGFKEEMAWKNLRKKKSGLP